MRMFKKITAILCAAFISGTALTTLPMTAAIQPELTVSAASTSQAPKLKRTQLSLGKGESYKLTADQSVSWRTSAPKILTVDKNGNVKAVGIGTAWITAKNSAGKETSCKITVKNAPGSVSVSQKTLTLGAGEEYSISAILPEGSASASRTFRSSNSSIVKMTKTNWTGSFKAVKTGTAWVTVRLYNGKEASCKITVKKAPTWVSISKKTLTLTVGQTATLSASIASDAGCAKRTFRTSNSSIVKMTKTSWTGSFKAVKTGTAWVTVRTYNGKESSCKITVLEKDYWKKLYKEKLRSLDKKTNYNYAFELYDVDKDGIPELFISYDDNPIMMPCYLYYVYNGQLKDPNISSAYGHIDTGYDGYIYTYSTRTPEQVYQKTGGTIKLLYTFGNPYYVGYRINGKIVSESEYNRLHDKYFSKVNRKNIGRAHLLRWTDIDKTIDNYPYVFEQKTSGYRVYATVTAYDKGNVRWSYKTNEYDQTELQRVCEIGVRSDHYYLVEGGDLVCLNKNTGKKLWQVSGVGASNKYCFDSSGNIYMTGYYGPMISKISPDGKLLWRFKSEKYMWPNKIELINNKLRLSVVTCDVNCMGATIYVDAKTGKLL